MGESAINADVAVLGADATGLMAALTCREAGARVILFDKQRSCGGTSRFVEGMFGVETYMQRQHNIVTTRDDAFKEIMSFSH